MRILVFAGAGSSVELGVPAMRGMVLRLSEHLQERKLASELPAKLAKFVENPEYDMENLIEQLDSMTSATAAFAKWGTSPTTPLEGLGVLRQEAEWFVNHICERVEASRAELMWGDSLEALSKHQTVIATTNYDRAIEMAAARRSVNLYDGFLEFGEDEWTPWRGFGATEKGKLLKVHGSTDWYHSAEGYEVWKLRHPMPLFGRVTMQVDAPNPLRLRSAAILPSREKKVNLHPYPDLAFELRRAVDESDLSLFLGTSLRDPDMRSLFRKAAQANPTVLVNPSPRAPDAGPATVIRQSASKFLASTLPSAFLSGDPLQYLGMEARSAVADQGILDYIAVASDPGRPTQYRCDAIEALADSSAALAPPIIRALLRDKDSAVRTYSLALVSICSGRGDLMQEAEAIAKASEDEVFSQELEILKKAMDFTGAESLG